MKIRSKIPALGLVAALPLTACGSAATGGAGGYGGSDVGDLKGANTHGLKGEPIVIADVSELSGVPGFDVVGMPAGAMAAASYINAKGGIGGRPIQVISCDSKFNSAGSKACATKVLKDDPIAITGIDDFSGAGGSDALYESRSIVTLNSPSQPSLLTSTNSFAIASGGVGEMQGFGYYMAKFEKAKVTHHLLGDYAPGHKFAAWIKESAEAEGLTNNKFTFFNSNATDFSAQVTAIAKSKPDATYTQINGGQIPLVWGQLEQQGVDAGNLYTHGAALNASVFERAGKPAVGGRVFSAFANPDDVSDPHVAIYREEMKKAGYDKYARTNLGVWGFANVMFLAEVLKAAGGKEADAASVKRYLTKTLAPGSKKSIPTFLAPDAAGPPAAYRGLHRSDIQILEWDGKVFKTIQPYFTAPALRPAK